MPFVSSGVKAPDFKPGATATPTPAPTAAPAQTVPPPNVVSKSSTPFSQSQTVQTGSQSYTQTTTKKTGIFSRLFDDSAKRIAQAQDIFSRRNTQNPLSTVLQAGGTLAGAAADTAGEAINAAVVKPIYNASVAARSVAGEGSPEAIKSQDSQAIGHASQAVGQELAREYKDLPKGDVVKKIGSWYQSLGPEGKANVGALGDILNAALTFGVGAEGEAVASQEGKTLAGDTVATAAKTGAGIRGTTSEVANSVKTAGTDLTGGIINAAKEKVAESPVAQGTARIVSGAKAVGKRAKEALGKFGQESVDLAKQHPAVQAAINANIPKETLDHIAGLSAEGKKAASQMVDTIGKNIGTIEKTPPRQVIGDLMIKATQPVVAAKEKAGKALDTLRKSFTNEKTVDATGLREDLLKTLAEKDATVDPKTNQIVFKQGATEARIPQADRATYQKMLDNLPIDKNGKVMVSQKQLDNGSNNLLYDVQNPAQGLQPFSDQLDRVVNQFRASASDKLGSEFSAASKEYAQTTQHLRDMAKKLGITKEKFSPEALKAKGLRASELARQITNQASSKPEEFIKGIQTMAKRYGSNAADEIPQLATLAANLDHIFGASQSNSAEAIANRAAASAAAVASGSGLVGRASNVALDVAGKMGALTPEHQQKALSDYIKHLLSR